MKKLAIIFFCSVLVTFFQELKAQKLVKNSSITSVCYAGDKINRIYIPPPAEFHKKSGTKGGASVKIFYKGFSTTAITAMDYAASILEAILPPETNVTILATWTKLETGVLANSSPSNFTGGWAIDAFKPSVYFPIALAEKIAGHSLNKNEVGDILLNINNTINWYYGIDGKTPDWKYDLVTVVIHEAIHGLGFMDSMYTDGSTGSYGATSIPLIYDTFIEDLAGKRLTDTSLFLNPSAQLNSEISSGNLFFNGPLLNNYTTGSRAKLYTPETYDAGSSISHLDENVTPVVDQLMTPIISRAEAIHDPGKLTMSILGDLGWINTRIIHEPLKDTEEHLSEFTIPVTIKSDTVYNHNRVGLVRSYDKFITSDTIYLYSPLGDDNYTTSVQISSYNTRLDYSLFTEDKFHRIYRLPSRKDTLYYSVYVGTDTVRPVIKFTPAGYYFETVDTIRFNARVTDNIGVDTVYIEYKVNDGALHFLGLNPDNMDGYSNTIQAKSLSFKGGDSLQFRIVALDKAAVTNQKVLPSNGFFKARIENINPVAERYSTDFSHAADDFFDDGIRISQPAGFVNYGLHTPHPYVSPEENGDSIGYIALLRTPVKFDANGMLISFMELVLVEPGETGSVYGTADFYDYVVVEGSKDFGKSWFPVADGYDSRIIDSWENAYNSVIDGNNSSFIGEESMMLKHTFFLNVSDHISAGDTMLVRFRLFSDPYANGWGWVIEDLHIGPLIDRVEEISYQPLVIYPNPGNGLITVRQAEGMNMKPVLCRIFNSAGTCIVTGYTDNGPDIHLDISGRPSGLYFIVLYYEDGVRTLKYNLIK